MGNQTECSNCGHSYDTDLHDDLHESGRCVDALDDMSDDPFDGLTEGAA